MGARDSAWSKHSRPQPTPGFTLVELVLVLALAALIIAGIMSAIGGGQRSQRDNARRDEAGRLRAAIANYASNHNGAIAGFTCGTTGYCANIIDVDTETHPKVGTAATRRSGVKYKLAIDCSGNTAPNNFSIFYWNENSGAANCIDGS